MIKDKQKKKKEPLLIIDIGTASVGAALVFGGKESIPSLDNVVRVPIEGDTSSSPEALLSHTEEALKKVLQSYTKESPKQVRVVVSAPWHEAHIRTITSHSERPTHISHKTALYAVKTYQDEKPPSSENVDIEAVAMQVQVNGYNTTLQKTVSGTSISINLYESEMRKDLQQKFSTHVQNTFPHTKVSFNTFPLVASVALRTLSEKTGFIVIDVAGEVTELSIVHDGGIRHLASFPIGFYSIARDVGGKKGLVGDTLSRLALLARGELSEDESARIQEEFSTSFLEWKKLFEEAVESSSEHIPISQTIYLLSDKEPLLWLKKGLEENNTYSFNVIPVDAPLVQNYLEIGEGTNYDIFLSLSALFFHIGKTDLIGESQDSSVVYSR